ncbi:hypothetical protein HF563_01965 [Acidithiobacillus ferridurans]|jgi:enolase|uniref:hypothetical protein n=1 Tax=Acidithiobacillus ferridurans TaxID=1232575 RepID=UPI000DE3FAC5|nr:hypothetical protein [Acidithiobacillus ferridurans]MBU2718182.1 hypothetical protein [Acidithiobacillus ferridurans]MBU2804294.1 hypothetical protein [Acidithiobacillus ferridurans]
MDSRIQELIANATLIKLDQIDTVTETITATRRAPYHGWGGFTRPCLSRTPSNRRTS